MREASQQPVTRASKAGYWIGLGLLVLAGIILFDTSRMQLPPHYAAYGPQIFPYISVIALVLLAAYLIWQTATGKPDAAKPEAGHADWKGVIAITVGLLSQYFLIETLGFVLSASFLFFAVAWGFHSRRHLRDAIVAVVLSLLTYLIFTKLLNLQLPPGIFKGVL
jgi:putative tricarboxylic transport membrane protein